VIFVTDVSDFAAGYSRLTRIKQGKCASDAGVTAPPTPHDLLIV
jgi:hypothetical protein